MKTRMSLLVAGLVMGVLAGGAQAAATYCDVVGSPNTDGLRYSDMTFNGSNADDCYGVVQDNDSATVINGIVNWYDSLNPWVFLAKDEDAGSNSGIFAGFTFTISALNDAGDGTGIGGTSGTWELAVVDNNGTGTAPDLPITLDFVGVIKGSNDFAAYLFDGVEVLAANDGRWVVGYLNCNKNDSDKCNTPGLSHLSLYVREGGGGDDDEIPEPGVLFLMGAGLLGLGMARRRKPA